MKTATNIRQEVDAIREHHIANWRSWAAAIAAGNKGPQPRDVIDTAQVLGIVDPGQQLERDAKVMAEVLDAERRAVRRDDAHRELLEPWGGDINKLKAEADKAQAEAARLAEVYRLAYTDTSAVHWRSVAFRKQRANPRLYGEWPQPRPAPIFEVINGR